jgi:hypothetical protein
LLLECTNVLWSDLDIHIPFLNSAHAFQKSSYM